MAKEFLYEKANEVLGHVKPNEDGSKEVGIEIILLILQLLPTIYRCWQDHKKAADRVRSPSFFDRMVLRRVVRRQLEPGQFRRHGGEIIGGILALGVDATEDDIRKYLESVG